MSFRTVAEFNHDFTHEITKNPEEFVRALRWYLNSADAEAAKALKRYGIKTLPVCHHSTTRKASIGGFEYPL